MTDLIITRIFKAEPDDVFDYITQHHQQVKWWGPETVSVAEGQLDFTRLGPWVAVMKNGEGNIYKVSGNVLSIEPKKSVTFSWAWHDDADKRGHESEVTFDVKPHNDGTEFTLTHKGLSDDESGRNHNEGWCSSFNKLGKLANS